MADVTPDRVRLRLGLSATDIADGEVETFIDEATAFLSEETGLSLDASNCSEAQANAIANLAAIYSYCKVTGLASTGWAVNLGSLQFSGPAQKIAQLEFLKSQVLKWVERNRKRYFGRA